MVFNVLASAECRDVLPEELPYKVTKLENVPIPMPDGKVLYAHIWLPQKAWDGELKVGCLVEYLPYRKNDFTAIRDSIRHPYYAGFGLALIRVDMRGCGDSDDVLYGEYLIQEQYDNLVVFDWIVSQKWANGKLGQFGKSWGGFNGLQVAALQHPCLKTIITLCLTDDRYADDVHYRGGCLLASDMLWWASTMFAYNARPQDPKIRADWKSNWQKRLALEPNVVDWIRHQRRDAFWKHGSICEDYTKVDIPVLAIGGWRDGYTNAVFRLVDKLPHPDCKGIVGPWVHEYPEVATPYPGIGYNQIAVSWFTKYLTDDAGILAAVEQNLNIPQGFDVHLLNKLSAYIQEPSSVAGAYENRAGKWITQGPVSGTGLRFDIDCRNACLKENLRDSAPASLQFSGAMEHGLFRGTWCPFGQDGDFPADQKIEDSKCLVLDTSPFTANHEFLGFPMVKLKVSSDCELANVTVRLVDLNPETNENYLVSWGMLNLSHANGTSENPRLLDTGHIYDFDLQLDAIGYKILKGHRLRLAFSTTDWPSSWPSSKTPTLTLHPGSEIHLPFANKQNAVVSAWPKPEALPPCGRVILRHEERTRQVVYDYIQKTWAIDDYSDEGKRVITSNGVELGSWNKNLWVIKENEPLSAYNQCDWELTLGRKADDWQVKLNTKSSMRADENNFYLVNQLEAFEGECLVFARKWEHVIERDFV